MVAPLSAQDTIPQPPDPSTWKVYTGRGEASSLDALIDAAGAVEVVFLGETHDDRVGHGLELEIFRRLANRDAGDVGDARARPESSPAIILSFEMFERDIQYVLDEYLDGIITDTQFRRSARPWSSYETDYRPVLEDAKARGLPVVAANAPRRYVNLVSRDGPAALKRLSETALGFLPPQPYAGPSPAYRAELEEVFSGHGAAGADSGASANGFYSQSLWDAAMAWSVALSLMRWPDATVVHLVGSFHVRNGTGIPEQLERYRPGTRRLIVVIEPVADPGTFTDDVRGAGDFVILTDESLSRSSQAPGS